MGRERLLPIKTLHPLSMMRPEEISSIVTLSSEHKVTYTQILTNQWEELEHSLDGSSTSEITIAKIKRTSHDIRRLAKLPEPRVNSKPQQPAQSVHTVRFIPCRHTLFQAADKELDQNLVPRV